MKFGKTYDLENIDFNLPQDHALFYENINNKSDHLNLYIGATSWRMKEWKSKWYPKNINSNDFFAAYVKQFNAIEFNSSYYALPKEESLLAWKETCPKDFKFYPKLPSAISRSKTPLNYLERYFVFNERFKILGEHVGAYFMQLSEYQDESYLPALFDFIEQIPKDKPLHVEFRSKTIFEDSAILDEIISVFKSNNVGLVLTDVAGRRDILHMACLQAQVLIRFVGNAHQESDYLRIKDWVERIYSWKEKGIKEIAFFVHQPDNLLSPELANTLASNLNIKKGIKYRVPKPIEEPQMSLFE